MHPGENLEGLEGHTLEIIPGIPLRFLQNTSFETRYLYNILGINVLYSDFNVDVQKQLFTNK